MNGLGSIKKKVSVLLLAALLAGITACSPETPEPSPRGEPSSSSQSEVVSMGRYIEEELSWPASGVTADGALLRPDGVLEVIATDRELQRLGPWHVYQSADGGKSWSEREAPWLAELTDNIVIMDTDYDSEGNLYLLTTLYTEEYAKLVEEALAMGNMPPPDKIPPNLLYRVSPDGTLTELPVSWRAGEDGRVGIRQIAVTDGGEVIASQYDQGIVRYSLSTGEETGEFPIPFCGDILVCGGTLIVIEGEMIRQFDLSTGDEGNNIPFDGSVGPVTLSTAPDEKSFLRCDSSGIYRWMLGGNIWERLVDGSLTSLGMPSVNVDGFAALEDNAFFVLIADDDRYQPLYFSYSADTPTAPSQELSIYSLRSSDTVRQAIGVMQAKNPDLLLRYEPVLSGDSVITVSDAVRSLNTELLAGKGPDVLVLDYLPVSSYQERGVLADLSSVLDMDALCPNIARTYEKDGSVFAVPARFAVPQMWGPQEAGAAESFEAFVNWAEKVQKDDPEGKLMLESVPVDLIGEFYLTCSPAWRNEDGSIRPEEFADFLTGIQRLASLREGMEISEEQRSALSPNVKSMIWSSTGTGEDLRIVTMLSQSFQNMAFPDAVTDLRENIGFSLMQGQAKDVYVPECVLGVNAASPLADRALEFVRTALSEKVQRTDFSDGYPVHLKALEDGAAYPYKEGDDGMQIQIYEGGEERWLQVLWPDEAFMKERVAQFSQLSTPSSADTVLFEMIVDETRGFFEGTQSLDAAVEAVVQRTQAYLSE